MALRDCCSRRVRELLACLLCAATMCVLGQQGSGSSDVDIFITDINVTFNDTTVCISFNYTDAGNNPAKSVLVEVLWVEADEIVLTTGYGTRAILSFTMKTHLYDLAPNFYTIVLMPIDDQGTAMLSVNTTVFLPGEKFTIGISSSNTSVPEFSNFTVTCTTDDVYVSLIELLINGVNYSNYSNVVMASSNNSSVSYIFKSVMPQHNGTNFTCVGMVNEDTSISHTSNTITISVLSVPIATPTSSIFSLSSSSSFLSSFSISSVSSSSSSSFSSLSSLSQSLDVVHSTNIPINTSRHTPRHSPRYSPRHSPRADVDLIAPTIIAVAIVVSVLFIILITFILRSFWHLYRSSKERRFTPLIQLATDESTSYSLNS